jgi:hypothetical protein
MVVFLIAFPHSPIYLFRIYQPEKEAGREFGMNPKYPSGNLHLPTV